jgi:hypothetical protein
MGRSVEMPDKRQQPLSGYTLEGITVSRLQKKSWLFSAGRLSRGGLGFLGLRGGLHTWKKDVTNLHRGVWLPMSAQTAIIFASAKMLNVKLLGRMIHDFSNHPHSLHGGLADSQVVAGVIKEHAVELQAGADFGVPVVNLDHVAFAYAVLPGPVLEHSIHSGNPAFCH